MCSIGGRRARSGRLGFDLTRQEGIDGVEPVVEVPVTGGLDQVSSVVGHHAE